MACRKGATDDVRVDGGKDSEVGGGERVSGGKSLAGQLVVDSLRIVPPIRQLLRFAAMGFRARGTWVRTLSCWWSFQEPCSTWASHSRASLRCCSDAPRASLVFPAASESFSVISTSEVTSPSASWFQAQCERVCGRSGGQADGTFSPSVTVNPCTC